MQRHGWGTTNSPRYRSLHMTLTTHRPRHALGFRALAGALLLGLVAPCLAAGLNGTIIKTQKVVMATSNWTESYSYLSADGSDYLLCSQDSTKYYGMTYTAQPTKAGTWSFTPGDASGTAGVLQLPSIGFATPGKAVKLDGTVDTATYAKPTEAVGAIMRLDIARSTPVRACTNFSSKMKLPAGGTGTLGFVVEGESRLYLIRAVSKSLARQNVSPVVAAPQLKVFDAKSNKFLTGSSWTAKQDAVPVLNTLFNIVGAAPLDADSTEQVVVWVFPHGLYTLECTNTEQNPGECLVEVYALPYSFTTTSVLE